MPCQTVTITAPDASSDVSVSIDTATGGEQEATLEYTVTNGSSYNVEADIKVSAGSSSTTKTYQISPASSKSDSFDAQFSNSNNMDVQLCATVENVTTL